MTDRIAYASGTTTLVGVAFCPHPPLLVPRVAAGASAELDGLRAACAEAIDAIVGREPRTIVVVGADGPGGGLRRYGLDLDLLPEHPGADAILPWSLVVGRWLLDRCGWAGDWQPVAVGGDSGGDGGGDGAALGLPPGEVALLVMGDGSARRETRSPGYLDERAVPFDAAVAGALERGDATALAGLDPALAAALLVAGAPAWRAAGGLLAGEDWRARLHYADAPYGVGYFVASWLPA